MAASSSKSLASAPKGLSATSVLPESKDVRFMDGAIGLGVGGGYAAFAASRPTAGQRLGWGLGGVLVGTLALVEGRGSLLKYGGAYVAAGSGAVMALELFGLTKKGL